MFTYLRSAYTAGEKNQQSVRLLFCLTGSQKTINNQKNRSRQTDRERERDGEGSRVFAGCFPALVGIQTDGRVS